MIKVWQAWNFVVDTTYLIILTPNQKLFPRTLLRLTYTYGRSCLVEYFRNSPAIDSSCLDRQSASAQLFKVLD